ncbi:MAG: DUF2357 domain-containing protein [Chloroflexi bacterium]|nr:DUF2357 domain-containing protein [Chloroflexota bacterium]
MRIGQIELRARRGTAAPEERDGRLVLQGEVPWTVTGPAVQVRQIAEGLGGLCERVADEVLLIDFGNAVGHFDVPVLGRIEVRSSKWSERDFDGMLADLMRVASALPFAGANSASLPFDRSVVTREDVLYHAFVYLRYIVCGHATRKERLLPALEAILREPHRRLERDGEQVLLERAHRPDVAGLASVVAGRSGLAPVMGWHAALPLARALRGHLPERIEERRAVTTRDTPENRFVKAFLSSAQGIVEGMRRVIRRKSRADAFDRRVLGDCEKVERALLPVVRHSLWRSVGPMVHVPVASTVLQRRRGYREIFQHYARLRLAARVPLEQNLVQSLLEAKDIAQLYEIWCYFTLVDCLRTILGEPSKAGRPRVDETQLTIPWDLEVSWPSGTRLLYNRRFSRARRGSYSYSVPLGPDISLETAGGSLHLFDAKFRLERLDLVMPPGELEEEGAAEEAEERRGTFKRGDLYQMHAYRDAIPRASSVWILYPGTELQLYAKNGMRLSLLDQCWPQPLEGIGAIPLRPSERPSVQSPAHLASSGNGDGWVLVEVLRRLNC